MCELQELPGESIIFGCSFGRVDSLSYCPIRNLQPPINNRKRLPQLLLVDAQRRIGVEGIPANQGIEPVLPEKLPQRDHLVRSPVKRSHRLPCLAVPNQLEDAEQS